MTNPTNIKKILIIQFRPFGDLILSTAGTELLKQHYPDAQIHFLSEEPFSTVLEEHPFIDKIILAKKTKSISRFLRFEEWARVRASQYDLVIDYQNGSESKLFLLFSGAKYRLGWANSKFNFLLNLKADYKLGVYAAIRNLNMLQPLGILAKTCKLYVTPSANGVEICNHYFREKNLASKKVIGIAVGSRDAKKQWHLEGYVQLLKMLVSMPHVHIVMFYAADELVHTKEVFNQVNDPAISIYVPTASMREVAALMQRLELLICNEGALNHLSCATQTKTICLIGPSDTSMWSPQGYFANHYHIDNDEMRTHKDFGFTAEMVFEKVSQII
jgi:ADP-heptose:LPS heptosyltransferase